MNVSDTETIIKERLQMTTAERWEIIIYTAALEDYLGNEINKEICRFEANE